MMGRIGRSNDFLRSRSGRGFLLFLGFSAVVSAVVACGFYYSSLSWFKAHKSEEKITALQLVDAFVTNYSQLRAQLGSNAPVPATFRAHSIDLFNTAHGSAQDNDFFHLRWVGRQGREIATPPTDAAMAQTIESFAAMLNPKPVSKFLTVDGQSVFRTVYPSLAEKTCVECHNTLQPDKTQWRVGDVMGAFAIDVPVTPFIRSALLQCLGLGFALFLALGGAGLIIAILNYRQARVREAAEAAVAASETRFRDFAESASDWFWEIDENMRLTSLSGTERRRAAARSSSVCWARHCAKASLPSATSDGRVSSTSIGRGVLIRISACRRPAETARSIIFVLNGKPFFDAQGHFLGYRGTGRDVTAEVAVELELARRVEERTKELRAAQSELVRSERLSALGQLTATVAHELRNPLSAIRNTVFVIKDSATKGGLNLERPITRVERNISRCDRIITDLLDYTRMRELNACRSSPTNGSARCSPSSISPEGIELVCDLAAPGCEINCDSDRLRRVVINLLDNAAQAIGELGESAGSGRITVRSRVLRQPASSSRSRIRVRESPTTSCRRYSSRCSAPRASAPGLGCRWSSRSSSSTAEASRFSARSEPARGSSSACRSVPPRRSPHDARLCHR